MAHCKYNYMYNVCVCVWGGALDWIWYCRVFTWIRLLLPFWYINIILAFIITYMWHLLLVHYSTHPIYVGILVYVTYSSSIPPVLCTLADFFMVSICLDAVHCRHTSDIYYHYWFALVGCIDDLYSGLLYIYTHASVQCDMAQSQQPYIIDYLEDGRYDTFAFL